MTETARRLAAILAADIAGYSRLMGADEDGTLARLKAHRRELIDPKIAEHRGRIVKTTGDGALVEFASTVDAVRCALAIQQAMPARNQDLPTDERIEFRIGINVGDIMVDGDDLYGDGVNVAARLENIATPGGICVADVVHQQVNGRIEATFADLGEQQLKNIARPLRVYAIQLDAPSRRKPGPIVGEVATGSGMGPDFRRGGDKGERLEKAVLALPDKPSIAVLPFQNMSGDAEQDYFCDGMVEDIITALARFHELFVIARNSSFAYKGKAPDIRQVGRELGVRYVLEGSVRKAGNRVRITGQLIEAETGAHLWADKFDGAVAEVFDLQDQITASVAGTIGPTIRRAEIERARRKRPDNLDAYDLLLRAQPYLDANNPAQNELAMPLLEQALALDPHYALAHGHKAHGHEQRFMRGGFDPADREQGIYHARQALALGGDDAAALALGGFIVGMLENDFRAAISAFDQSIALNGNSALAYGRSACIRAFAGDFETAIEHAERSLRLSPYDQLRSEPLVGLTFAYWFTSRFAEAAASATQAIQANPAFPIPHALLIAAQAEMGQLAEARASAQRLLAIDPRSTASGFARQIVQASANAERGTALCGALLKAGLPE
jgi:TolB-like protein/class 3 adenylate cyclase/Tfp pilus assembly protein PilF